MKKVSKIIIIFIVFLLINVCFANVARAAKKGESKSGEGTKTTQSLDDVVSEAGSFIDKGQSLFNGEGGGKKIESSSLTGPIKPIAQALRTIGIGVLLCITAFMGIKWVTAKPDEVAKLKQQSIGLLVSAIVIIGAYTIWSITLNIVSKL